MSNPDGFVDLSPIELHSDGSFSDEVGIGAWAFVVPTLHLNGVGSEVGKTAARFELLAVLHGLEAITAAGNDGRPVRVFSDCDSTVAAIERLCSGLPLKRPEAYADRADLLPQLQAVLAGRSVQVTRYKSGRLEHQHCHRTALGKLREEVAKDPKIRHRIVLARLESRLDQLVGERGVVLSRLEKLDDEISIAQLEIQALGLSMRNIGGEPASDRVSTCEAPA
jgi:ribonuclease HI